MVVDGGVTAAQQGVAVRPALVARHVRQLRRGMAPRLVRTAIVLTLMTSPLTAVLGAAATPATAAAATPATAPTDQWTPVYDADFPDPSIMLYNGTYYAYSTGIGGVNVPGEHSSDAVNWNVNLADDAMPTLPQWAVAGKTWAPTVAL